MKYNKIVIQFNSQSKSGKISEAIKLAKSLKAKFDGKYYEVLFNSINDKNLLQLSNLIGFLSGSRIFIDDEDCGRPYSLDERLDFKNTCPEYEDFCNGNCSITMFGTEDDLKIARRICKKFKEPKIQNTITNEKKKREKIVFQFNSKSRGGDVPEAIKIAKSLEAEFDGKNYMVYFDSVSNENLLLLDNLVGSLSGTRFFLNDKELDPLDIRLIFNCNEKSRCNGKCVYTYIKELSDRAKKFCEKFDESLSIEKPLLRYNGCEIKWINNEDDPLYPKNPDNKYVLIDSSRTLPGDITGVEMEMEGLFFDEIKYEMMDEEEPIAEEEGYVLNTSGLGIIDIAKIEGLEKLTELKGLNLGENAIFEIKGIDKLINLEYLSFGGNNVSEIKGLENLVNLKGLILQGNQINEIKGLENLINLFYLDISENPISEIKGLENLINLKYLHLNEINITEELLVQIAQEKPLSAISPSGLKTIYSYYNIPDYAQKFVKYCQRKKAKMDREDKEKVKIIKKILIEADSIQLDTLRNALKMDVHNFNNKILDWSIDYGFEIDGDYLITNKNTVSAFIDELDKYFTTWDKIELKKNNKI